jgi:hypothetical protein
MIDIIKTYLENMQKYCLSKEDCDECPLMAEEACLHDNDTLPHMWSKRRMNEHLYMLIDEGIIKNEAQTKDRL